MSDEARAEPEWVQRMRAAGYNIRVGRGEPLSEIPEVMFDPPLSRRQRIQERIVHTFRSLFRLKPLNGRVPHAPLP
jgi:hypothetical protein